ncbi:MAG: hypothetical protein ACXADW_13040 [Candidatus Hodarchaeales archaeon]|jgi:hypothetical protein
MKNNITLFMYSHSTYSDAWSPFFSQSEKYLKEYKKVVFSDECPVKIPDNWNFIKYDNKDSYSERVYKCLEEIDTELCFLHHEDMFLYGEPQKNTLSLYEEIVEKEDIDFIRLLRSVDSPSFSYKSVKSLFPIPSYSQYYFSVQPTICKTESLINICKNTKISHLREFEIKVQEACRENKIKGLFHYDNEPRHHEQGSLHYESKVYPYVATAIVKGKWNFSGYGNQLKIILDENKIDVDIRGKI